MTSYAYFIKQGEFKKNLIYRYNPIEKTSEFWYNGWIETILTRWDTISMEPITETEANAIICMEELTGEFND